MKCEVKWSTSRKYLHSVQSSNFIFSLSLVLFLVHNSMWCCILYLVISTVSEVACCYLLLINSIPFPKNPCLETFTMYFNGQNNNTKNTKTMVIIKTTNESPTMSINVHIRKFNFLIKNKMFPH